MSWGSLACMDTTEGGRKGVECAEEGLSPCNGLGAVLRPREVSMGITCGDRATPSSVDRAPRLSASSRPPPCALLSLW